MLINKENKKNLISAAVTLIFFLILFTINYQYLLSNETFLINSKIIAFKSTFPFLDYVILPSLVFIFLQILLLKYINFLWATSISALSIFSYAGYDFKKFIYDLIFNNDSISNVFPKQIILLEKPGISFSILVFLVLTLFCLDLKKYDFTKILLRTLGWTFFSLISFMGSLIGIIFWIIFSSIRIYRLENSLKKVFVSIVVNILIFIIFIVLFFDKVYFGIDSVNNIYKFSLTYFFSYFLIPIMGILIIYIFYKIDFFELLIKFTPIYVLMLSDFIISIYLANNITSYTSHEYFIYPHFILHFLYIVPIIYYLARPLSPFVENQNSKINSVKKFIYIFFNSASKFYLPLIILLLCFFSIIPSKLILS